jgi:hypothetical protein
MPNRLTRRLLRSGKMAALSASLGFQAVCAPQSLGKGAQRQYQVSLLSFIVAFARN